MNPMRLLPVLLAAILVSPAATRAHCDTLDGPVVSAARAALESGKLEPVLAWVQPADEPEIRDAFTRARAVRKGGKDARALADRWFFETLVRVHRAGEGAPFTGLKAGGEPEPVLAAADRVAAGGDPEPLEALLVDAVREGLHEKVARLRAEQPPGSDVAAGRRWVAAYVPFVHWAEGVQTAAEGAGGHGAGGHAASEHGHGAAEPPARGHGAVEPAAAHGHEH